MKISSTKPDAPVQEPTADANNPASPTTPNETVFQELMQLLSMNMVMPLPAESLENTDKTKIGPEHSEQKLAENTNNIISQLLSIPIDQPNTAQPSQLNLQVKLPTPTMPLISAQANEAKQLNDMVQSVSRPTVEQKPLPELLPETNQVQQNPEQLTLLQTPLIKEQLSSVFKPLQKNETATTQLTEKNAPKLPNMNIPLDQPVKLNFEQAAPMPVIPPKFL